MSERTLKHIDTALGAALHLALGTFVIALIWACVGCSSSAPVVRAGGLEGLLVLDTPKGDVTVDLGSRMVVGDGADEVSVKSWSAKADVVLEWQGVNHTLAVDVENLCTVVRYVGLTVIDYAIPGTCDPLQAEPKPEQLAE